MTNAYLRYSFAGFGIVAALVACSGTPYVPISSTLAAQRAPANAPHKAQCTAPVGHVPGTYTNFTSFGKVKGNEFRGEVNPLVSQWRRSEYTPTTGPSPTASPPPPAPSWVYYGTFKLRKGGEGCAFFITSQSGTPEFGKFGGAALGLPHFKVFATPSKTIASGESFVLIKNISKSGGSGTVKLKTSTGTVYDSGTITLIGRVAEP